MTANEHQARAQSIIFAQREIVRIRTERDALRKREDWTAIERLNRSEDKFAVALVGFWEALDDSDARAVRVIVDGDPSTRAYSAEWDGWEGV